MAKGLVGLEKYEISAGPMSIMGSADRRIMAPDNMMQMFMYEDKVV